MTVFVFIVHGLSTYKYTPTKKSHFLKSVLDASYEKLGKKNIEVLFPFLSRLDTTIFCVCRRAIANHVVH